MKRRVLPLLILAITFAPMAPSALAAEASTEKVVVPVFSLNGPFPEKPVGDDMLFGASGMQSFHQLIERFKKARDDDDVKAVVVLASGTSLGNAQIEEVRRLIGQLKDAGKPVFAHADSLTMRSYVLLSGASRLSVVTGGDLWLTGLYGESLHLRGLLDMIGVTPDFMTCGAYKSAAEMYTRDQPSKEADENINWLLDGVFDSYVQLIADGRETDQDTVLKWIDVGLHSAATAKEKGIIDAVEYRQEMVDHLKSKLGDKVKFDKKYGKKKGQEIDFSSFAGIIRFYSELLSGPKTRKSTKDAIAIVYVDGAILPGSPNPNAFPFGAGGIAYSTPIRKALDKVAEDETVKGVVLRVNSPGGSAVASEIILQATKRVKEKKPIVVSMGNVAGSGGYYVACGADTIFVEPSTVTASIGVVGGKLATGKMWHKIGVTWKDYKRGKNAALLAGAEPFSDEEGATLQLWMDEIYEVFKGHVLKIRKDRLKKDLDELAGGRVFTGRQALEYGLVDKLGGLDDAIATVAKDLDLEEYEIRVVPRPKNFAELLTESLKGGDSDDDSTISIALDHRRNTSRSLTDLAMPYLRNLEPERLGMVKMAVDQLNLFGQERVVLTMPLIGIRDR